jgi:hypothetical protein
LESVLAIDDGDEQENDDGDGMGKEWLERSLLHKLLQKKRKKNSKTPTFFIFLINTLAVS